MFKEELSLRASAMTEAPESPIGLSIGNELKKGFWIPSRHNMVKEELSLRASAMAEAPEAPI